MAFTTGKGTAVDCERKVGTTEGQHFLHPGLIGRPVAACCVIEGEAVGDAAIAQIDLLRDQDHFAAMLQEIKGSNVAAVVQDAAAAGAFGAVEQAQIGALATTALAGNEGECVRLDRDGGIGEAVKALHSCIGMKECHREDLLSKACKNAQRRFLYYSIVCG